MKKNIAVIGGANVDLSATLRGAFIASDSNPGYVHIGYGGVARNIAHNLALLGANVQLVSCFGSDILGELIRQDCINQGLHLDLSQQIGQERNGMYLCINNHAGDMIAAVADTDIMMHLTPGYLEQRMEQLNHSDFIVADTNISAETLQYLIEHATAPVFVDGVCTVKAERVTEALRRSDKKHLFALKLNQKEALSVTGAENYEEAAVQLLKQGVDNIYITLGSEGAYCCNAEERYHFPALPGEVVNTTGAGDAFLSGVVWAYVKGLRFADTAQYGLMAARAALTSPSAVNPDIANLLL